MLHTSCVLRSLRSLLLHSRLGCISTTNVQVIKGANLPLRRQFSQSSCRWWDLGQGLVGDTKVRKEWKEDEKEGWKTWVTDDTLSGDVYRLLTSAIIPRPIAFVSTVSTDGVPNLAPTVIAIFPWYVRSLQKLQSPSHILSKISHNPPLLTVSLSLSPRGPKDTRENIKSTKEFTVNIISEPFVEAANASSVEAPGYVDEWIVSGLTPVPSNHVRPPRVKESAVNLECELYELHDITPPGTDIPTATLVLGLIKQIHIRNAVLSPDQQTIDPHKLQPVARLGGNLYSRLDSTFELERPSWKALKERIDKMMDHEKK